MMAVDVKSGATLEAGAPRVLPFSVRVPSAIIQSVYDVTPDGRQFVVVNETSPKSPPATVMLNWTAGLNK